MIRITLLILSIIAACSPAAEVAPSFCGATCQSSEQCRHDFGACRVCFGGVCSESLPAQPTPSDAGNDATPGDTTSSKEQSP